MPALVALAVALSAAYLVLVCFRPDRHGRPLVDARGGRLHPGGGRCAAHRTLDDRRRPRPPLRVSRLARRAGVQRGRSGVRSGCGPGRADARCAVRVRRDDRDVAPARRAVAARGRGRRPRAVHRLAAHDRPSRGVRVSLVRAGAEPDRGVPAQWPGPRPRLAAADRRSLGELARLVPDPARAAALRRARGCARRVAQRGIPSGRAGRRVSLWRRSAVLGAGALLRRARRVREPLRLRSGAEHPRARPARLDDELPRGMAAALCGRTAPGALRRARDPAARRDRGRFPPHVVRLDAARRRVLGARRLGRTPHHVLRDRRGVRARRLRFGAGARRAAVARCSRRRSPSPCSVRTRSRPPRSDSPTAAWRPTRPTGSPCAGSRSCASTCAATCSTPTTWAAC